MSAISYMQARLAVLARSERGMAVPVVLTVMVVGLGLSAAAISASISAQSQTNRDQSSKDALAIADAGVQRALLNKNKIETWNETPCVVNDPVTGYSRQELPSPPSPWCGPVGGSGDPDARVGNGYFTYQVMPCGFGLSGSVCAKAPKVNGRVPRKLEVVSTGCSNTSPTCAGGVTRRVAITAQGYVDSLSGSYTAGAIGRDGISTDGSSTINTNVGTNGDVVMNASSGICGDIQIPPDHQVVNPDHQCPGHQVTHGHVTLPAIDTSSLDFSSNDRITTGQDPATGNISWDPSARMLSMQGNSTLTLGGTDYSFCSLQMTGNSQLIMAAGANVRIFIDSPENCPGVAQPQLDVSGNFSSTGWDPANGNYDVIQIYMLGSTSGADTSAVFTGSSDSYFQLYAPSTDVTLWGNATYNGGVAAKSLNVGGSAQLNYDPNMPPPGPPDPNFVLYTQQYYVECGPAGSSPDANC